MHACMHNIYGLYIYIYTYHVSSYFPWKNTWMGFRSRSNRESSSPDSEQWANDFELPLGCVDVLVGLQDWRNAGIKKWLTSILRLGSKIFKRWDSKKCWGFKHWAGNFMIFSMIVSIIMFLWISWGLEREREWFDLHNSGYLFEQQLRVIHDLR